MMWIEPKYKDGLGWCLFSREGLDDCLVTSGRVAAVCRMLYTATPPDILNRALKYGMVRELA